MDLFLADLGPGRRPERGPHALPWALVALAAGLLAAAAAGQLGRRRRVVSR